MLRTVHLATLVGSLLLPAVAVAGDAPAADSLRLNQIQTIGTHNSYHIAMPPASRAALAKVAPDVADSLDYTHRPLGEQFSDQRIRQIELDLHNDPQGGRFVSPLVSKLFPLPAFAPRGLDLLSQPGPKILHVPDVDYLSTVATFDLALNQIRQWSVAHPRHVPIFVLVELKVEDHDALPTKDPPFTAADLDALDAAVRRVFPADGLITPDDLRGNCDTLPDAIRTHGWPRLADVRGRVLFGLNDQADQRDMYLAGHPSLQGRAMFANAARDTPAAAWRGIDDPIAHCQEIRALVRDGYLVRTRADADTLQSRHNDPTQRDAALATGAQFVSTDYPDPDRRFSSYQVALPGLAVARPNPINAGALAGQAIDLEAPY
jgi:hypothetical protein